MSGCAQFGGDDGTTLVEKSRAAFEALGGMLYVAPLHLHYLPDQAGPDSQDNKRGKKSN